MADKEEPLSEQDQFSIARSAWEEVAVASISLSRMEQTIAETEEGVDAFIQLKMIELHTILAGLKLQFIWPSQKEKE